MFDVLKKSTQIFEKTKKNLAPNGQVSNDTSLALIKEKVEKERELEEAMKSNAKTVSLSKSTY